MGTSAAMGMTALAQGLRGYQEGKMAKQSDTDQKKQQKLDQEQADFNRATDLIEMSKGMNPAQQAAILQTVVGIFRRIPWAKEMADWADQALRDAQSGQQPSEPPQAQGPLQVPVPQTGQQMVPEMAGGQPQIGQTQAEITPPPGGGTFQNLPVAPSTPQGSMQTMPMIPGTPPPAVQLLGQGRQTVPGAPAYGSVPASQGTGPENWNIAVKKKELAPTATPGEAPAQAPVQAQAPTLPPFQYEQWQGVPKRQRGGIWAPTQDQRLMEQQENRGAIAEGFKNAALGMAELARRGVNFTDLPSALKNENFFGVYQDMLAAAYSDQSDTITHESVNQVLGQMFPGLDPGYDFQAEVEKQALMAQSIPEGQRTPEQKQAIERSLRLRMAKNLAEFEGKLAAAQSMNEQYPGSIPKDYQEQMVRRWAGITDNIIQIRKGNQIELYNTTTRETVATFPVQDDGPSKFESLLDKETGAQVIKRWDGTKWVDTGPNGEKMYSSGPPTPVYLDRAGQLQVDPVVVGDFARFYGPRKIQEQLSILDNPQAKIAAPSETVELTKRLLREFLEQVSQNQIVMPGVAPGTQVPNMGASDPNAIDFQGIGQELMGTTAARG